VSKRKRLALIALVWAVAAILCVLPSVWPWFHHLISTQTYETFEAEATGFGLGYMTRYVTTRRR